MKVCSSLLAIVLVCLITVEGRNLYQQDTDSDKIENVENFLRNRPERHKRNRRQLHYRHYNDMYSFQNNGIGDFLKDILYSVREIETHVKQETVNRYYPSYYNNRPDYSNKCEDSLQELLFLVKTLTLQLKYSTPPPRQIIYIPYNIRKTSGLNITDRFPADTNQIWMDIPQDIDNEDDGDGSRPVFFEKKQPKKPNVPLPPQGNSRPEIPTTTPATLKEPGMCETAILTCCGKKTEQERENCFGDFKCSLSYKTGMACNPKTIEKVLAVFKNLYGPTDDF